MVFTFAHSLLHQKKKKVGRWNFFLGKWHVVKIFYHSKKKLLTQFLYVFIETKSFLNYKRQKDRKTERQKDRKTERQKDKETERRRDRKIQFLHVFIETKYFFLSFWYFLFEVRYVMWWKTFPEYLFIKGEKTIYIFISSSCWYKM